MFVIFEDAGHFSAGKILSENDSSLQVETPSGKRSKVKNAHCLMRFEQPTPEQMLSTADLRRQEVDLDLAWSCAPDEDFHFSALALDYFGDQASLSDQLGMLLRLQEAPHFFRRLGKGQFRKASAEVLEQALKAIAKRQEAEQQIGDWAAELIAGHCHAHIEQQLYKILFKPDKNSAAFKAVAMACKNSQQSVFDLLQGAGALRNAYELHWQRFLLTHFPNGTDWPAAAQVAAPSTQAWPLAPVQACSIDDSSTTEIDDALSLQGLGTGTVTLGIHIAAPGLALQPGDAVDVLARGRLSSVYMPGHKITMLPDAIVSQFTLGEGQARPALSLYLEVDEQTHAILGSRSVIERVPIQANLRHDQLDTVITPEWLSDPNEDSSDWPEPLRAIDWTKAHWSWLWQLAQVLKHGREQVRGKPETFARPDYQFQLTDKVPGSAPVGTETVRIEPRKRGAPLDLIVAEAMILANSTWGACLSNLGVPGIYRSQASLAPGVKVRMGTKALPHAGLGVPSYAWSTSPLRRYTDLVNQWQLIACITHGSAAALAAPFKPKDTALWAIVSGFEATYAEYNQFQNMLERYWTLQHITQTGTQELVATVVREASAQQSCTARADHLPLVLSVAHAPPLARGTKIVLGLGTADLIKIDISATFKAVCASDPAAEADAVDDQGEDDAPQAAPTLMLDDPSADDSPHPAPALPH
jgi:exoribonuclease II